MELVIVKAVVDPPKSSIIIKVKVVNHVVVIITNLVVINEMVKVVDNVDVTNCYVDMRMQEKIDVQLVGFVNL